MKIGSNEVLMGKPEQINGSHCIKILVPIHWLNRTWNLQTLKNHILSTSVPLRSPLIIYPHTQRQCEREASQIKPFSWLLTLMANVYVCVKVCVQSEGPDKQHLSSLVTMKTLNKPNKTNSPKTSTVSIFNKLFNVAHTHQTQLTVNMTWPAIPESHFLKTGTPFQNSQPPSVKQ